MAHIRERQTILSGRKESDSFEGDSCIGIFWLEPEKWTAKNDVWKFVHITKTPLTRAEKVGDAVLVNIDHYSIWESLKPHNIIPQNSEYDKTPRGRIVVNNNTPLN